LAPHVNVDFASPEGPNPPIDEGSVKAFTDEDSVKFLHDPVVKTKLENAKKLSDIDPKDYDVIFYVGGHGPVLDLATDAVNIKLASEFYQAGKVVSAVCHGTGALVGVTDASGKPIWAGRKFTGFSNAEEEIAQMVDEIPFLLETKISELGGKYEKAAEPFGVSSKFIKAEPLIDGWDQAKVVVDGKLITGQNPASAAELGQALLAELKA